MSLLTIHGCAYTKHHTCAGLARTAYLHRIRLNVCLGPRGGYLRPRMGMFLHVPRAGGRNWQVQAQLCYVTDFLNPNPNSPKQYEIPLQLSLKPAGYGHLPQQPRREPNILSSHMLYLTSQRTKLSDVWCFEVLIINQDEKWGKKISGWRDMQINMPFPLECTHLGYRCTTCAFNPVILYTGRLV